MICAKCKNGEMRVIRNFVVSGNNKVQERRCVKCCHVSTHVLAVIDGERSAYSIAKALKDGREKLTVSIKKARRPTTR